MKICYVILHYNAIEVTHSCIDSILNFIDNNNDIVIVDNASPNGSGEVLKQYYSEHKNIHVIINKKNLGFARGNNIGYRFARDQLKANIIIDMNNDIEILNKDFETIVLLTIANITNLGIISPRIINIKGFDQNPYRIHPMASITKIRTAIIYNLFSFFLLIPGLNKKLYSYYSKKFHRKTIAENEAVTEINNIVPHGSFIIFCPSFVKTFKNAFSEDTFFYGEEDILYDMVIKYGLQTIYKPSIRVLHKEKISTSTISENAIARLRFAVKNKAKSSFVCVKHRLFGYKNNLS